MNDLLNEIKDANNRDHAEMKDELKYITRKLAPIIFANKKAVAIILGMIGGAGLYRAAAAIITEISR